MNKNVKDILNNEIKLGYILDILMSKKLRLEKLQKTQFVDYREEIETLEAAINDLKDRYSK